MGYQVRVDDKVLKQLIKNIGAESVEARTVHDGVEYGIYVELGTSRMGKRPALIPSFERVTKLLPRAIGMAIEKGIALQDIITKAAYDVMSGWRQNVPVDTGAYKNSITVSKGERPA